MISLLGDGGRQPSISTAIDRSTIDGCNAADLHTAIGMMIYCMGLSFNFAENPYFKQVLKIARTSPTNYEPPKKDFVGGPLLDLTYDNQMNRDYEQLLKQSDEFGLGFSGDCATLKKAPLTNVLAHSIDVPAMVCSVIDCTKQLIDEEGGKKDGPFLARLFLPIIEKLDPNKTKTDIVFFDGGSNMQLAGRIIEAVYPRVTVVHAAEHLIALMFSDMGKISSVRVRLVNEPLCLIDTHLIFSVRVLSSNRNASTAFLAPVQRISRMPFSSSSPSCTTRAGQ